jgi:hypothetical protein
VTAAVEALLFAGYGEEDDGGGELELAEDAGAFEGDGGAAGVVVGAGCGIVGVGVGGVAGVVVAGDEDVAIGLGGVSSAEDGVDVGELGGLGDAGGGAGAGGFDELVAFDLEAVVAVGGVALELGFDPVGGGVDAGAGGKVGVHAGEGAAIFEGDELGDDGLDVVRGDLLERGGDGGIGGCDGDGLARRRRLLRVERAEGEGGGESGEAAEAGEETGADGHESSPYVETEALLQSYA